MPSRHRQPPFGGGLGSRADGQRCQSLGDSAGLDDTASPGADRGLASGSGVNLAVPRAFHSGPSDARFCHRHHRGPYPLARFARLRLGITRDSYIRIEERSCSRQREQLRAAMADERACAPSDRRGAQPIDRCQGRWADFRRSALDVLHFLSAGAVSFARGLNDTPRLSPSRRCLPWGVQPDSSALASRWRLAAWWGRGAWPRRWRKNRRSTSARACGEPHDGGFGHRCLAGRSAGSTTHVATGGLFGIGLITGTARLRTIASIPWPGATTLPPGSSAGCRGDVVAKEVGDCASPAKPPGMHALSVG